MKRKMVVFDFGMIVFEIFTIFKVIEKNKNKNGKIK